MEDFVGKKFGRWEVVSFSHKEKCRNGANYYWNCKCECGKEKVVSAGSLRSGSSTSCGCYNKEIISKPRKHGMCGSRLYGIWHAMIDRCTRETCNSYRLYGGRGITVCDEWFDSKEFIEWAFNNGYKEDLTLDRVDSNGNYEPSNCRWVDWKTQANNTRRNHFVTIGNETLTVSQWAEKNGLPYKLIYKRTRDLGWSFEKALTTPLRKRASD